MGRKSRRYPSWCLLNRGCPLYGGFTVIPNRFFSLLVGGGGGGWVGGGKGRERGCKSQVPIPGSKNTLKDSPIYCLDS